MGIKQNYETANAGSHNTITSGTTVKGSVFTETDFRLDGKIEGDVTCNGKLVVGPKGGVKGNIVAPNAEILGEVEGGLTISGILTLKSTAVVKGEINTQSLEIEANAIFEGSCSMKRANPANNNPLGGIKPSVPPGTGNK